MSTTPTILKLLNSQMQANYNVAWALLKSSNTNNNHKLTI